MDREEGNHDSRRARRSLELPPALQPFGAVPPLVSDIDLSVDDRWLYVSCWGTGELKQYDVSDPHNPREAGSVRMGGIVGRTPHPGAPELQLAGAPQMVEISRDGRRVYFTNSLYASWDDIFYPDGVGAWMARIDANTDDRWHDRRPAVLPERRRLPRAEGAPDPPTGRGCVERFLLFRRVAESGFGGATGLADAPAVVARNESGPRYLTKGPPVAAFRISGRRRGGGKGFQSGPRA